MNTKNSRTPSPCAARGGRQYEAQQCPECPECEGDQEEGGDQTWPVTGCGRVVAVDSDGGQQHRADSGREGGDDDVRADESHRRDG